MGCQHLVRQGEHASAIADLFGFAALRTVWESPENADLRERRPNPHVLFPGDRVWVPPRELREESGGTEACHLFRVLRQPLTLRLVFEDPFRRARAALPCRWTVEGQELETVTDHDGMIVRPIRRADEKGTLPDDDLARRLLIGHLDPVEKLTGCAGRLRNLGYYRGRVPEVDDAAFRSAVEEFQCDEGLTVDGVPGPKTQAALRERHGC